MRNHPFALGEYYHLYNRGTDRRDIFMETRDYTRFMALLYLANDEDAVRLYDKKAWELINPFDKKRKEQLVNIGAYCLIPNHFHLLVKEIREGGVSSFMQKLGTAYTNYFNCKYERAGSLFQGTFKSKPVDNDQYLKYLFSYIHLNPLKIIDPQWKESGIQNINSAHEFLDSYPYSSYQDYAKNIRLENAIIEKDAFPNYFSKKTDFQESIDDFIKYGTQE